MNLPKLQCFNASVSNLWKMRHSVSNRYKHISFINLTNPDHQSSQTKIINTIKFCAIILSVLIDNNSNFLAKKKKKKKKTGTAESFLGLHFGEGMSCSEVWEIAAWCPGRSRGSEWQVRFASGKSLHRHFTQKRDRGRPRVKNIGKFLSVCWQIFNSLGNLYFCFPSRKSHF